MKLYIAIALCVLCAATARNYDGYQVWRVTPQHDYQRQWLRDTEVRLGDVLDFWSDVKAIPGSSVDIMVPPGLQSELRNVMAAKNLDVTIMFSDVEHTLEAQRLERLEKRATIQDLADFDYSVYHTYDEIQTWVDDVVAAYPDLTEKFTLDTLSFENRDITGMKIRGTGQTADNPQAVWFEGGIHAREWISPATVMYLTNKLLEEYTNGNDTVIRLLDTLDWYVIPSLNVDGYVYTWTDDRLWRKTRSDNSDAGQTGCMGVDPNRNWPFEWGGEGTSAWPCSNVYRGTDKLTEQEVEGVVDFLRAKKAGGQDFILFIDWHSYSQLIISPWSYSEEVADPVDIDDIQAAGDAMAAAILNSDGETYEVGPTAKLLYAAAGASNDYGYAPYDPDTKYEGGLGAKYSYVVELRDTGTYGFLLPEDQILDTGEESYQGVLALGTFIIDREGL